MKTREREDTLQAIVKQTMQGALGNLPIKPNPKGSNYGFLMGEGPEYVAKIGPLDLLRKERFALDIYEKEGIPAARVACLGSLTSEEFVLITHYIQHEVTPSTDYKKVGEFLHNMHRVTLPGIGDLDPVLGRGTSASWADYLGKKLEKKNKILEPWQGIIDDLLNEIHALPEMNHLLHLDYTHDNILCKEGKVVAVIDPTPSIGDPLADVGRSLIELEAPHRLQFLQGYAPAGLNYTESHRLRVYIQIAALYKLGFVRNTLKNDNLSPAMKARFEKRADRYAKLLTSEALELAA